MHGSPRGYQPEPVPAESAQVRGIGGLERPRALGVPAIAGLMVGHVEDQTTLPIGCLAELDADAGTLTLLEPGVR